MDFRLTRWRMVLIMELMLVYLVMSEGVIQGGIAQLNMNGLRDAQFSITHNKFMNTTAYNNLVNIGYINEYDPKDGIIISSQCPKINQTSTNINCSITLKNGNTNNLILVTYIISNHDYLLIGNFQYIFKFQNETNQSTEITTKVPLDKRFFNTKNSALIKSLIFLSGVSTLDSDFQMTISGFSINLETSDIMIPLRILQMHKSTLTVTFGFVIYDPIHISISIFENLEIVPGILQEGMLYGISRIMSKSPVNSTQGGRRLQSRAIPILRPSLLNLPKMQLIAPKASSNASNESNKSISSNTSATTNASKTNNYNGSNASSTFNVFNKVSFIKAAQGKPTIQAYSPDFIQTQFYNASKKSVAAPLTQLRQQTATQIIRQAAYQPSSIATMIKSETQFNFKIKASNINPAVFNQVTKVDAILDTASPAYGQAITLGLFNKATVRYAQQNIEEIKPQNDYFNKLFSTNGFVISATSTELDPIYYFQVNPVQEITSPPASRNNPITIAPPQQLNTARTSEGSIIPFRRVPIIAPKVPDANEKVYIQSIVSHKKLVVACKNGIMKSFIQKIDFIQKKAVIFCDDCPDNQVADASQNKCVQPQLQPLVYMSQPILQREQPLVYRPQPLVNSINQNSNTKIVYSLDEIQNFQPQLYEKIIQDLNAKIILNKN